MKLKQFFEKYSKQILIMVFILFALKSFQSCNRHMSINAKENQIVKLKDSLTIVIQTNTDTINALRFKLDMANVYREAADTRADAVQSVAEKITKNTTVKVEK